MNVKAVKLTTGEDVICEFEVHPELPVILMKNPVQLLMVPSKTSNQPQFGMVPYPIYRSESSNTVIEIESKNLVFVIEPAEQIINEYNALFGSGIVMPPKGVIV